MKKYLFISTLIYALFAVLFTPQLSSAQAFTTTNTTSPTVYGCVALTSNLHIYSSDYYTGGQVSQLQTFLKSQGYYTYGSITGFFGPLTYGAVVRYQLDHGISGSGYVGQYTRASIQNESCSTPPPPPVPSTPVVSSLSPTSGTIGSTVTIYGSGFNNDNNVSFGYGNIVHVPSSNNGTVISFTVPSSLNPTCYYSSPQCLPPTRMTTNGQYSVSVSNSNGISNALTYTVVGSGSTTGAPTVSSLTPTTAVVGTVVTVYGTGFTSDNNIRFDIGTINHVSSSNGTSLTFVVPNYISPSCPYSTPNCLVAMYAKQVTPGTYNVSVENTNGVSSMLPLIISSGTYPPPSNQPPTILSVSGPVQLGINQNGTWSVRASDPSNGQLTYSVLWGDENRYAYTSSANSFAATPEQTSTFNHTYSQPGTYTITFTVTNASGASTQSTISVYVNYWWTY